MRWKITPITHRGEKRIMIEFPNDASLNQMIRNIQNAKWSKTLRAWHVSDNAENRMSLHLFNSELPLPEAEKNERLDHMEDPETSIEIQKHLKDFVYYLESRRYRPNTIKTYREALHSFLKFWKGKDVYTIVEQDVVIYNNEYIIRKGLSATYQNQIINAIKLFFSNLDNRKINLASIHRPRGQKKNPNVLSKEEVKCILEAPRNLKHRTMLSLTYACGLRCGEVLNLKIEHIDSNRLLLVIKDGKGGRDRVVPISNKVLNMLRDYYKVWKPQTYLFEGQNRGAKYDERSFQLVLKQTLNKTGIRKPVTLHWLRHSFATHLLDGGIDLRYIQELLGHKSSRTTEIYTHVSTRDLSRITLPFDTL